MLKFEKGEAEFGMLEGWFGRRWEEGIGDMQEKSHKAR